MSDSEPVPRGPDPTPPDSTLSSDALRSESDPFSGSVSNPPTQPMTKSDAPPTSGESNGKAPAGAGVNGEAVKELRSAGGAVPAASHLPEANSSGEDLKTPVADGMEKRRRRTKSVEVDEPRPTWLPSDWDFIVTVRGQGNSAGTRDRYFIDPKYHHRFRSRIAVEKYLLTGVIEKQLPKSENNKGKIHRSKKEDSKSTLALSHSSEPPNNDISTLEPTEAKRKKRRSRKEGSNHINTLSHSSEPPNNDISTLEPTEAKRKKRRSRKEESNRNTLSLSSEPPSNDISTLEPTKVKRKRRRSRKEDSNHINTLLNSSGLPKNGISTPKPTEASKIDFTNLPTTVRWTLTGAEGQVRMPYVVNEEPPETSKKEWAALECLCSCLEQQIQKSQQSVPRSAAGLGTDPNQDVENKEKIIQQSRIEKNAKGVEKLQRERGRKKGPILDRNLLEKLGKELCRKYQALHPEEDQMHITSSLKT